MSESQPASPSGRPDELAQRFVQFVIMQAQQILYVLGAPSPEGDGAPPNLEAAKIFIDQLEMIREKTKGNLSAQEAKILDDAISRVQLAFVQASGGTPASMMPSRDPGFDLGEEMIPEEEEAPAPAPAPQAQAAPAAPKAAPVEEAKPEEPESKKRYVKSYG